MSESHLRLARDPGLLYKLLLAVSLPVLAVLGLTAAMALPDVLEAVAAVVVGPLLLRGAYRVGTAFRVPDNPDEKVAWLVQRVGLTQREGDGLAAWEGHLLDDPEALEVHLPASFEPLEDVDGGDEVWYSDELRAVIRRSGLEVTLVRAGDEQQYRTLLARARTRGALPGEVGG